MSLGFFLSSRHVNSQLGKAEAAAPNQMPFSLEIQSQSSCPSLLSHCSSLRQPPPHQTLTACQTLHCMPCMYHFSFDIPATLGWEAYYPPLMGKETEAQRV